MRIFQLIILYLFSCSLTSLSQSREILLIENDTIDIIQDIISVNNHQSPIGLIDKNGEQIQTIYWAITNDSLFQIRLYNTDEEFKIFQGNLDRIIYLPQGVLIKDFGLNKIYSQEKALKIKNGILKDITLFDNSKSKLSPLSNLDNKFYKYLSDSIDFNKIGKNKCEEIYLKIDCDAKANIKDVQVLRRCDEVTNKELIRTIKSLQN